MVSLINFFMAASLSAAFSNLSAELIQSFGNDSIENDIRAGDRKLAAQHSELELVAGESERRRTVSVRIILGQCRDNIAAQFQ